MWNRRLATLVFAALIAGCRRDTLPERIRIEEPVLDLAAAGRDAEGQPLAVGGITPHRGEGGAGGHRRALLAPADGALRFRVRIPPDAALRFGVGVDARATRPVRFAVAVDGRELFSRAVDQSRRRGQRWFDERVALPAGAGREVEIALVTHGADAGWSPVRVVRERFVDRQAADALHPNVLVLLVDTLRADRLGCYGADPSPTPTLDALAGGGRVFADNVAQAAWTMPSVASIMTGLHPRSHGVLGGPEPGAAADDRDWAFLPSALPTIAGTASAAGITTVGVSANPLVSRGTNLAHGFETFVDVPIDRRTHHWATAGDVNAAFLDWLRANRGHRFLGYLHFMEPHDPYTPPDDLRPTPPPGIRPRLVAGDIVAFAEAIDWHGAPPLPESDVRWLRTLYDAEVRSWDRALASLIGGLDAAGIRSSTVIVVTADHGEEFQEHGRLKHGSQLFEESIRTPLVIQGPGIATGRTTTQTQGIDVFPTVAALLGATPPATLPGRDVLAATDAPPPAFLETRAGPGDGGPSIDLLAVRSDGWKLVRDPVTGRTQLFDLAHDPTEHNELSATSPEGAPLAARLDHWLEAAPSPPRADGADSALRQKLRALGYLQ